VRSLAACAIITIDNPIPRDAAGTRRRPDRESIDRRRALPNGSVTASVKLPAGQTGVLIVGGTSKYVWVATFKRASASAEVVRIATA